MARLSGAISWLTFIAGGAAHFAGTLNLSTCAIRNDPALAEAGTTVKAS